jgi:hypothetical protein
VITEIKLITKENFADLLDTLTPRQYFHLAGEVLAVAELQNSQSSFNSFTLKNLQPVFEKPWKWHELFVPALRNVLRGGTPVWQITAEGHTSYACADCAYSYLYDLYQGSFIGEEPEFNEPYNSEDYGVSVGETVNELEDDHICRCGVKLLNDREFEALNS